MRAAALALVVAAMGAACHRAQAPEEHSSIPREMAVMLPAEASVIGGIDFARLRALGLEDKLSGMGLPWAASGSLQGGQQLVAAMDGRGLFAIARGTFAPAPAGAKMITPELAVLGPDDAVQAAEMRRAAPRANPLMDRAEGLAKGSAVWLMAHGSSIPPLPGNAANVTRLLQKAEWVTVTVRGESDVRLEITAECATEDAARRIEETARASFALAAAAEAKKPAIAAMLKAVKIEREGGTARLRLEASAEGMDAFLKVLR